MVRSSTPSFILTLPLQYEAWQRSELDKIFRVCNTVKNNLIADRKKAICQLERTHAWKDNQAAIANVKAQRLDSKQKAELLKSLYEQKNCLLQRYGFSDFSFQTRIQKWRHHYSKLISTHMAQKLASSVWSSFRAYFSKRGEAIHFSPWTEFRSIEGKSNESGIIYRDGIVSIGKLKLPVKTSAGKKTPSGLYEQEALSHRVKYCRIIRRWYPNGWMYLVQLVLEGEPPVKVNPKTGKMLHPMGAGTVGLDIGPQTLAACGDKKLSLSVLAENVQTPYSELRRINRAMDRSRRAQNPEMFALDGTIVPINQLPDKSVKDGKRIWVESKRYQKLKSQRRYLYGKLARKRKQAHQELANQILSYGNEFIIEKMNWAGLAKRAKKAERSEKTGKMKRKKRFGKSIANKAPALFTNVLTYRVKMSGGHLEQVDPTPLKASQYNHEDKAYHKKKLSKRWNTMSEGKRIQRDLYSAFLLKHADNNRTGFNQSGCEKDYPAFVKLHDSVMNSLLGTKVPSSVGI